MTWSVPECTQYQGIIRWCTIFSPRTLYFFAVDRVIGALGYLSWTHFSFCSFLLSLLFPICLVNNLGGTKNGTPEILPVCNKFCFMTSCCFWCFENRIMDSSGLIKVPCPCCPPDISMELSTHNLTSFIKRRRPSPWMSFHCFIKRGCCADNLMLEMLVLWKKYYKF